MIADSGIRNGQYVYETFIDFKEKIRLRNRWNVNLQAYFLRDVGIMVEYTRQNGRYFSELKWYGWYFEHDYIPINHFEEAYWHSWSLSSYSLSVIIGGNRPFWGEVYPYALAGFGSYSLKGDPELFLNRSRLGPRTNGTMFKVGGGVRFRILPFLGVNFKLTGETVWRNNPNFSITHYEGPDQFDLQQYYESGKIVRYPDILVRSLSYFGLELGLEFILRLSESEREKR